MTIADRLPLTDAFTIDAEAGTLDMSLRLLLILIGVAIVAGVYFIGLRRRQRDAPVVFGRRFTRDMPDITLHHEDDADLDEEEVEIRVLPPREATAQPAAPPASPPAEHAEEPAMTPVAAVRTHDEDEDERTLIRRPRPKAARGETTPSPQPRALDARAASTEPRIGSGIVLPATEFEDHDLPRVRHDALLDEEPDNARQTSEQLDLFGAAPPAPTPPRTRRGGRTDVDTDAEDATNDNGVITLFVRATEKRPFGGPELVRSMNAVGLKFGDMSIFHHFGAGDLRTAKPLFSAANMFEPGTFDLGRIEAFRTTGIVMFMQLPGALEGPVAFELLLNTAQRLAELLGGEIYATPQAALDPKGIARLRRRAARHARAAD